MTEHQLGLGPDSSGVGDGDAIDPFMEVDSSAVEGGRKSGAGPENMKAAARHFPPATSSASIARKRLCRTDRFRLRFWHRPPQPPRSRAGPSDERALFRRWHAPRDAPPGVRSGRAERDRPSPTPEPPRPIPTRVWPRPEERSPDARLEPSEPKYRMTISAHLATTKSYTGRLGRVH